MKLTADRTDIVVPGSIVGFGTGYSILAAAIIPADHVNVRAVAGAAQVSGLGLGAKAPDPTRHPTVVALRSLLDHVGAPQVGVHLAFRSKILRGSGLGSFEAEVIAGLVAATRMLGSPDALDEEFLLDFAEKLGADRLRAMVSLGGGAALRVGSEHLRNLPVDPNSGLEITAFVPSFTLDERSDQDAEPRAIRYSQAQRSAASLALQLGLLAGTTAITPGVLMDATENAMRAEQLSVRSPASTSLVTWFRDQQIPAFVCGSGPSVICYGSVPEAIGDAAVQSGWSQLPLGLTVSGALTT
ncbi:hypothetical protein U6G28_00380 [Actinomycetaceae bacterium MB13-C1-2]|nr:hypothetical protein U6G28_00380 [Actinomycetaceae bacterium MB13-C1-2]